MKNRKHTLITLTSIAALALASACGDDDNSSVPPDAGDNQDAGDDPSAFPTLGAQIDRVGRPAISTALISSMLYPDKPTQASMKNDYNADDDVAGWGATWSAEIATNIAVLDGLDGSAGGGSGCGNSFGFGGGGMDAYDFLASVLADDRLLIDPQSTTCTQYLAVEAGASGAGECGGRTPTMDVVETSYSAIAIGALSGVDDGVASDDVTHSDDTFPFLAAPSGS